MKVDIIFGIVYFKFQQYIYGNHRYLLPVVGCGTRKEQSGVVYLIGVGRLLAVVLRGAGRDLVIKGRKGTWGE